MGREAKKQFLIRDEETGKMVANVLAYSHKGALELFLSKKRPSSKKVFQVKVRGEGDWVRFSVT